MKISELEDYLDELGVPKEAYSLNGATIGEEYCIERIDRGWSVYYAERGLKTGELVYPKEEKAVERLIELLKKDVLHYKEEDR